MSVHRRLLNLSLITAFGALLIQAPASRAEELPAPIRSIEAKGAKIVGSFAAQYQNRGMALYLTPDGKHVIAGNLYDAEGKDLSQAPLQKLVYAPMSKQVWGEMEKSNWIEDGKQDAPRIVYLFSDPNCPYCNMFWEQARPWVESGKVQLRHIMVGIMPPCSPPRIRNKPCTTMKRPARPARSSPWRRSRRTCRPSSMPIPS